MLKKAFCQQSADDGDKQRDQKPDQGHLGVHQAGFHRDAGEIVDVFSEKEGDQDVKRHALVCQSAGEGVINVRTAREEPSRQRADEDAFDAAVLSQPFVKLFLGKKYVELTDHHEGHDQHEKGLNSGAPGLLQARQDQAAAAHKLGDKNQDDGRYGDNKQGLFQNASSMVRLLEFYQR